jgi:predicted enzyme related to lactoylglutathione lyase
MSTTRNILCWVDIPVENLDRAIGFYSAVLGATVSKQTNGTFEFGLLPYTEKSVSGCIYVADDTRPSETGPLIYLSVEGRLDAAVAASTQHGGLLRQEKHQIGPHGYRAIIKDSEGNRIALHSMAA